MARAPYSNVLKPANVAQLNEAIDRGETADKVDFPDPAASPLGTDDEAAGVSPASAEVTQALQHEASPARKAGREPKRSALPVVLAAALVIMLAAVISYLLLA